MAFGFKLNLIRSIMPSLIKEGLSGAAGLRFLQSQGLGIRHQTFQRHWREFTGIEKKRNAWKYTPRKFNIPEDAFVTTERNLGARRQYIFDVDIKDTESGDIFQSKYSFTSDKVFTRQKAEETMFDILEQAAVVNEEYQDTEPISVLFDVGLKRPDLSTFP